MSGDPSFLANFSLFFCPVLAFRRIEHQIATNIRTLHIYREYKTVSNFATIFLHKMGNAAKFSTTNLRKI